ncbi:FMR1-interacting protein NUFIP1-like [Ornithodoros turicata]|uniref:FMR1-interacting protein NUFIP1-like n=1 Tax=Ornithodoros turicata TaxID=34597 RepID=UPI003139E0AA
MSVICAGRELLANPFRPCATGPPIITSYVPVVVEAPKQERIAAPTCSQSSASELTPEDKPWLTEEVKVAIKKKNELYKVARESQKPDDWAAFKKQRFAIGKLIRATKQSQPRKVQAAKSTFYCDPCDRAFVDQADYHEHVSGHVTCGREGCRFSACAKLVELHVKLQHDTGLIRRIPAEGPEDAEEWIKQRKARYPTLRNIAAKKAQQQEMKSRREVLDTKTWKKRGNRFQRRRRKKGKNNKQQHPIERVKDTKLEKVHTKCEKAPEADWMNCEDAGDFKPEVSEKVDEKEEGEITGSDSEDPVTVAQAKGAEVKKEIEVPSVLKSLIDCYGSSSEDETPEVRVPAPPAAATVEQPKESSLPEEPTKASNKVQHQGQKRKQQNAPRPCHTNKKRLTLLEKLLANEMRHERNILLQCVHFVVKNKFFEDSECHSPKEEPIADLSQHDSREENCETALSVLSTDGIKT